MTRWQCYLSHFCFYYRNGDTLKLDAYQLVDIADSSSIHLPGINLLGLEKISFAIGVDSVKTMEGVFEGALDPINDLFWTWQSGYINFKIELEDNQLNERVYHIGGYSNNSNTFRQLEFSVKKRKIVKGISFDVGAFLDFVIDENYSSVMSPGNKAVKIADRFQSFFSIVQE